MLRTIGRQRLLLPLPFWLLTTMGFFMEALPKPLITRDQVKLLRRDNVVARRAKKLQDLGITSTAAEAVLPTYLARFKTHRRKNVEILRPSDCSQGASFFISQQFRGEFFLAVVVQRRKSRLRTEKPGSQLPPDKIHMTGPTLAASLSRDN